MPPDCRGNGNDLLARTRPRRRDRSSRRADVPVQQRLDVARVDRGETSICFSAIELVRRVRHREIRADVPFWVRLPARPDTAGIARSKRRASKYGCELDAHRGSPGRALACCSSSAARLLSSAGGVFRAAGACCAVCGGAATGAAPRCVPMIQPTSTPKTAPDTPKIHASRFTAGPLLGSYRQHRQIVAHSAIEPHPKCVADERRDRPRPIRQGAEEGELSDPGRVPRSREPRHAPARPRPAADSLLPGCSRPQRAGERLGESSVRSALGARPGPASADRQRGHTNPGRLGAGERPQPLRRSVGRPAGAAGDLASTTGTSVHCCGCAAADRRTPAAGRPRVELDRRTARRRAMSAATCDTSNDRICRSSSRGCTVMPGAPASRQISTARGTLGTLPPRELRSVAILLTLTERLIIDRTSGVFFS